MSIFCYYVVKEPTSKDNSNNNKTFYIHCFESGGSTVQKIRAFQFLFQLAFPAKIVRKKSKV